MQFLDIRALLSDPSPVLLVSMGLGPYLLNQRLQMDIYLTENLEVKGEKKGKGSDDVRVN